MTAAVQGDVELVRLLISRGANASLTDAAGATAVQLAQTAKKDARPDLVKRLDAIIDLLSTPQQPHPTDAGK